MQHAFDEHALERLVGPDPDRQRNIYALFVDTSTQGLMAMRAALEDANLAALGVAAHRLKSGARLVGAPTLGALAAQIEVAADRGEGGTIAPLLVDVEVEAARTLAWVRARLDALVAH